MDAMRILKRKAAREEAHILRDMICEEIEKHADYCADVFFHVLQEIFPKEEVIRKEIEPMSESEARDFGRQIMPNGEFEGYRVDDVPLSRLLLLTDRKRPTAVFYANLERYVLSQRFQREQ